MTRFNESRESYNCWARPRCGDREGRGRKGEFAGVSLSRLEGVEAILSHEPEASGESSKGHDTDVQSRLKRY